MKLSDIKRVLILGSGTMGRQIGFLCALKGYNVVMYDISMEALEDSLKGMEDLGAWFISTGLMPKGDLNKVMGRIKISSDSVEAANEVDLISESVPDIPEIKARVFAKFNKLCPERTVFTTNTSMLLPSMFAEQTGRPQKLVALHFHDARTTNIVDVMTHPKSEPETVELVRDFAESLGQVVIMLNCENSGYVFNSMLSTLLMSALTLAANGVATIEDVDRSWMGIMRAPIGPFGIMDQIGLPTVWTIIDYAAKNTGDPQAKANAAFIKQYIDNGALGLKTMGGFYSYPKPAYSDPRFISGKGAAR
jgi:3-hydroxybutyryl-CoA dehydrogenase